MIGDDLANRAFRMAEKGTCYTEIQLTKNRRIVCLRVHRQR
jgi:hypothetical protein